MKLVFFSVKLNKVKYSTVGPILTFFLLTVGYTFFGPNVNIFQNLSNIFTLLCFMECVDSINVLKMIA